MITLLEINMAVNYKLIQAKAGTEFSTVEILAEDVSEPLVRPSLKVALENSTNGKFNSTCREKTLTYRVYFFAKDRKKNKFDNIKMQEIIENAFIDGLTVKDGFFIPIDDVSSEVTEGVLVCSFDIFAVEEIPEQGEFEIMDDLNIRLESD